MALKRRIKKLEEQVGINEKLTNDFFTVFSNNQIKYASGQLKRMPKWCDKALIQGYKLKFTCGYSGYRELLNESFPLPSLRTLNEKLDGWKFTSDISDEIFQFLQLKISTFKSDKDKDCLIVLDEISITSGIEYDARLLIILAMLHYQVIIVKKTCYTWLNFYVSRYISSLETNCCILFDKK